MPYVLHTEFQITPVDMRLLEVGSELEVIASTLKSILPNQHGHIWSHAIYSMERPDMVRIIFESKWEEWDDLIDHRDSDLNEAAYLQEWAADILKTPLRAYTFGQIGI